MKRRELIVGIVFGVLLALLLGVTIWIKDPGFWEEDGEAAMRARFREVAGLKTGDEVWLYGTTAGRVTDIRPDGQGKVLVDMELEYEPDMREDAEVKISTRSALGGAVVSIHPGTPERPALRKEVYDGITAGDPFAKVSDVVAKIEGPLTETIEDFRKIAGDFSAHSEKIAGNIDAFAADAASIADRLERGEGTLGKLLSDDKLHKDLEEAVAGLRKISDDANGGGGTIDVLLHDQQLSSDLQESVRRVRSITTKLDQGEGTLGKLLEDAKLYDDLSAAVADLREITNDARTGKGVLGKLIYDEQLSRRLDTITDDVAQVTGKLRRGEGTLGKLIQDEQLYADLRNTLRTLSGGAEDVRENAPILTFAGVLFSGF